MSAMVVITGANPNPPDADVQAYNGEFVVLQNLSQAAVDVGGWFIRDARGVPLVMPYDATIPPGGRLRIYTGPGTDGGGNVYCNRRRAVLNNKGDTLTLFDRSGTLIQRFSYGDAA